MSNKPSKGTVKYRLILIFWSASILLLWQVVSMGGMVSQLLLPSPAAVLSTLKDSFLNGELAAQLLFSLKVIFIGILVSVAAAALLVFSGQRSLVIQGLVQVLSVIAHPLPALALLPLIIVWFGTGEASILAIIIHSAIWPVLLNLKSGFSTIPPIYLDAAKNLELNTFSIAFEIQMMHALPHLISGIKIAFARSWRALIGSEMVFGAVGSTGGIGWYIFKQRTFMNTPGLFAGILVVVLVGILVESVLFRLIEKNTVEKWGN